MTGSSARGQVVVSGRPFAETLDFFVDQLGFRPQRIVPADDPALAVVAGHGLEICIDRSHPNSDAAVLRLQTGAADSLAAPNGMTIEFTDPPSAEPIIPELVPELVISRAADSAAWVTGRAEMRYRDLIPSRLGGRFIASHIEVCDGGPVPDLVHHHAIRFQMIFCHRGWVDVVYEDQGRPFRLEPGDCVLQPPHIRHRVLESSAGAQVVEIGCPAQHDTLFDHELELPNDRILPGRRFGGQFFVRHDSTAVPWGPSVHPGFEVQNTAIEEATDGLAGARIIRAAGHAATAPTRHDGEFWFLFVLDGTAGFAVDGATTAVPLAAGDSVTVPAGLTWALRDVSPDLVLLEVTLPA